MLGLNVKDNFFKKLIKIILEANFKHVGYPWCSFWPMNKIQNPVMSWIY